MKRNGNGNGNGSVQGPQQARCAIYTRKSTNDGLDQEFNSLDAQRESAEAYIASQKTEGWVCLPESYDDGGFTGGNSDRPALQRLLLDIEAGKIDCVVVYKVDRLSRSLMDFARMMETFDRRKVSFVSVTQQFNTTHSMGRLTLNILLSFAQFEREIISERTRDKIAATRRKGKWSGGMPVLGYDIDPQVSKLIVNAQKAKRVRAIFELYIEKQSLIQTVRELNKRGWITKQWTTRKGHERGGRPFDKSSLFRLLSNVVYLGKVRYKDEVHAGEHEGIIDEDIWQRVRGMLRSNGRTGGTHIRNKYGALLKGLLYCKPCARAMMHTYTAKGNRRYRYYVCYTAQKRGWDACPSKSVPAEEIERFVVEQIRAIARDPGVLAMTLEAARSHHLESIKSLESDVLAVHREIRHLGSEIKTTAIDAAKNNYAVQRLADLHERLRTAERQKQALRDQITLAEQSLVTKAEVDSALSTFDPLWESLTPSEQIRVFQLLIKRVDYDGSEGKVAVTFHENGLKTLGSSDNDKRTGVESCPAA